MPAEDTLHSAVLNIPALVMGAGPAGLMAAESLQASGIAAHVFDAMPSAGRKLLLAGLGGLNITHAEGLEVFVQRYGPASGRVAAWLQALSPQALRQWVHGLGIDTFVGSSQRVFPAEMKAAPLLRAWLHRLRQPGQGLPAVTLHQRHRWVGPLQHTDDGLWQATFATPDGELAVQSPVVVLALGGGSWAKLGSDGAWLPTLHTMGVPCTPLRPANCGWQVASPRRTESGLGWSDVLASKWAGTPLKNVVMRTPDGWQQRGECVLSAQGLEGSLVYAAGPHIWPAHEAGPVTVHLNLRPDVPVDKLVHQLSQAPGKRSVSDWLRQRAGLAPVHVALLRECLPHLQGHDAQTWAHAITALPVVLSQANPIDEAISTQGGVKLDALNADLMLTAHSGVFCAGEMLDWDAPTGGYLLTASWASGRVAGCGAARWLTQQA